MTTRLKHPPVVFQDSKSWKWFVIERRGNLSVHHTFRGPDAQKQADAFAAKLVVEDKPQRKSRAKKVAS